MNQEKHDTAQAVDDDEVVARVLRGEKNAYELIMRKYNQRLFRIARSYLKREDEIEDVLQEAYIRAYEALPRFERRSRFSTWLIRIVINEALARLKQRRRFVAMSPHPADAPAGSPEPAVPTSTLETPVGELMNAELKQILEQAVDRLPEKYRSVFVMREIEGMSTWETSEALDITETNVKVRLSRAKGILRESISGFYRDAEVFQFNLVRCDRIVRTVMREIGALDSPGSQAS